MKSLSMLNSNPVCPRFRGALDSGGYRNDDWGLDSRLRGNDREGRKCQRKAGMTNTNDKIKVSGYRK